ncbi:sulfotransferase domain-containing protein [Candidatus Pelagibacter ubique]|nr:sulfotransferase domain-containing protein [Candidatus Pelagibacter ubique]
MFVWLASYPKSGNTLVRSLLAAYFFSKDGVYNFDLIKNIKQFPNAGLFESLGLNIKNEKELIKNYIKAQDSINKRNEVQFLKTHSYLFNIEGNGFTDLNNSLGAVYIVRDPRNVVSSLANFLNISIIKAADHLIHSTHIGGSPKSNNREEIIKTYTGTWNGNFNSWKSFVSNKKYLLIKYEDLIFNKEENLKKILKFIYKLKNIKLETDETKLKNVIESTSFENMKNLEKKGGFTEARINKVTGEKIPFFNLGPKNDWKNLLNLELTKKIEKAFKKEMKELEYL